MAKLNIIQQDMIFFVLLSYCCKIKAKELQNYTVHGADWRAETDNDPGIKIHQGEGESMWAVSEVSPFLDQSPAEWVLSAERLTTVFPIFTPSVYNPLSAQRAITHSAPFGMSLSSKPRQNESILLKYPSLVLEPLAMLVL